MNRSKERELEAKGYNFTGRYTHDKTEAKNYAATLRGLGFKARVVLVIPSPLSRGGGLDGYSVYSTAKSHKEIDAAMANELAKES